MHIVGLTENDKKTYHPRSGPRLVSLVKPYRLSCLRKEENLCGPSHLCGPKNRGMISRTNR